MPVKPPLFESEDVQTQREGYRCREPGKARTKIVAAVRKAKVQVASVAQKKKRPQPAPRLPTSKFASRRALQPATFHLPKRTMGIAQQSMKAWSW